MIDILEILSQPGGELVLWDYCLEQNIIMPGGYQYNPFWATSVTRLSLSGSYRGMSAAQSNGNNQCYGNGYCSAFGRSYPAVSSSNYHPRTRYELAGGGRRAT